MIKIFNMVQHPTIGALFLDEHTTIDSNANRGFMQSSQMPFPEQPSVYWPDALHNEETVNMRFLTHNENPTLVSYVVNGQTSWPLLQVQQIILCSDILGARLTILGLMYGAI